jgi:hypothetical protein
MLGIRRRKKREYDSREIRRLFLSHKNWAEA